MGQKSGALSNLESLISSIQAKHEIDLQAMAQKFANLDINYKEDSVETQKQRHIMELEREENTRLNQLYRTQNEVLDTQNRQYADKLESLEK